MFTSKKLLAALTLSVSMSAGACPGAGLIKLEREGKVVAVLDTYEATIKPEKGYSLKVVWVLQEGGDPGQQGIIDDPGDWQRIGEKDIEKFSKDGTFSIPKKYFGRGEFRMSLSANASPVAPLFFELPGINVDPDQPRAKSMGRDCSKTVQSKF